MINKYKRKVDYNKYKPSNLLNAKKRMLIRFKRNKINIKLNKGSKILLLGSLEYIKGLESLGKNEIHTCDIVGKPHFIKKNIKHKKTDLKKIKFNNNYFDFIFCNGILSHSKSHHLLLKEMHRVLKKEGKLWLNVYGKNKLTDYEKSINKKLNYKDKLNAKKILNFYNWETSKINFILELFFFDEKYIFDKLSLEKKLKNLNFEIIKFCMRGADSDFTEMIYKNKKLKKILGFGDLRFLLKKK